jgi:hypothetical protein
MVDEIVAEFEDTRLELSRVHCRTFSTGDQLRGFRRKGDDDGRAMMVMLGGTMICRWV